eukprot:1446593-Rhodomonas_salina.1
MAAGCGCGKCSVAPLARRLPAEPVTGTRAAPGPGDLNLIALAAASGRQLGQGHSHDGGLDVGRWECHSMAVTEPRSHGRAVTGRARALARRVAAARAGPRRIMTQLCQCGSEPARLSSTFRVACGHVPGDRDSPTVEL